MENENKSSFLDIAVLIGAIVYFVSPLDLIPDIAPLGFVDDTTLLTLAFNSAKNLFTSSDFAKANEQAARLLGDNFDAEKAAEMTRKFLETNKKNDNC